MRRRWLGVASLIAAVAMAGCAGAQADEESLRDSFAERIWWLCPNKASRWQRLLDGPTTSTRSTSTDGGGAAGMFGKTVSIQQV